MLFAIHSVQCMEIPNNFEAKNLPQNKLAYFKDAVARISADRRVDATDSVGQILEMFSCRFKMVSLSIILLANPLRIWLVRLVA